MSNKWNESTVLCLLSCVSILCNSFLMVVSLFTCRPLVICHFFAWCVADEAYGWLFLEIDIVLESSDFSKRRNVGQQQAIWDSNWAIKAKEESLVKNLSHCCEHLWQKDDEMHVFPVWNCKLHKMLKSKREINKQIHWFCVWCHDGCDPIVLNVSSSFVLVEITLYAYWVHKFNQWGWSKYTCYTEWDPFQIFWCEVSCDPVVALYSLWFDSIDCFQIGSC